MKKAFDQTVRDLKRGVNKNVLKVPGVEQKILDATSNEPWGPHGSLLADIAQATRNYHEYQMIMTVIWKRINDTGKNWRHVYKGLTVLEYLVAHGSERVIDEIREHVYQISTLSDFQYIDSSGRDQGSNIRKKSQILVALVNDKERIIEVREKAHANRDKFRNTSSAGGMYRPGSYSGSGGYDDDRYDGRHGSREDDRNGYGREREWGYRDDDRSSRDGDYGREHEERYGRDRYRDDEYRGRSQSDEYQYGSRSRSSDRNRDHTYDDDGQYSSRGNGARGDDQSRDGSRFLERKFSEQNLGAPPTYEETVSESRSPVQNERDGETATESAPTASFPPVTFETTATESAPRGSSPSQQPTAPTPAPAPAPAPTPATSTSFVNHEVEVSDEFDPRAARTASNSAEMDLLGSLSDSLAIVPATSVPASYEADTGSGFAYTATQPTSTVTNQPFGDPFGDDSPFKAIPSADSVPQTSASPAPFQPQTTNFDLGGTISSTNYPTSNVSNVQPASVNSNSLPQELSAPQQNIDILADILPPPGPLPAVASQTPFSAPTGQIAAAPHAAFTDTNSQPTQPNANYYGSIHSQAGSMPPVATNVAPQTHFSSHIAPQPSSGPTTQLQGINFVQQPSSAAPLGSQPALPSSTGSLSLVPQPSKDKFEPKSTVWADTLSKGLVNLNISGSKINPLADIGIDFDAINRKEKRMGKPVVAPVTSTVTMGKAMGSGSGMGRAAASTLRPPPNPVMNSNPGMGMGVGMGRPAQGMGMGMGMGSGYGGMNQPMGMGNGNGNMSQPMGMGIGYGGMSQPMGMNMGMGMVQGYQMQPPARLAPGSTMGGGYNPMPGTGGYPPQRPYSGSYQ